ncbi:MAG: hypothetical protein M1450_01775 [Patescibacteria group bacterium]|nr:hypothetical protein [Patescibacteria group bacterium]
MNDFRFLQNPVSKKWMILAPRRAKRPDVARGMEPRCPFCPGREGEEEEVYRVSENRKQKTEDILQKNGNDGNGQNQSSVLSVSSDIRPLSSVVSPSGNWLVRVLPNKFPFAPIHEVIIHSPDHHKNFDQLPVEQTEHILETYRERFNTHKEKGQVYIFHNRGEAGGESLPHPHTQLAVVPSDVKMEIPRLDPSASYNVGPKPLEIVSSPEQDDGQLKTEDILQKNGNDGNGQNQSSVLSVSSDIRPLSSVVSPPSENITSVQTEHFYMFCPKTSQWPDEVWIAPKKRGRLFGEITDEEIKDLARVLPQLIRILDLRHGKEPLPFNFHIYPGGDWYLRLIPRLKTLGGFELGTGIFINTQDPSETIAFIKEHFENPNEEKIKTQAQADYKLRV